jgi:hypothetical protein
MEQQPAKIRVRITPGDHDLSDSEAQAAPALTGRHRLAGLTNLNLILAMTPSRTTSPEPLMMTRISHDCQCVVIQVPGPVWAWILTFSSGTPSHCWPGLRLRIQ